MTHFGHSATAWTLLAIEPQSVITRDNVAMEVDAVIDFVVIDPVRAAHKDLLSPGSPSLAR